MANQVKVQRGFASVVAGDTLVLLVRQTGSRDEWRNEIVPQLDELAARRPEGVLLLSLILPDAGTPDASTRAAIQDDFRRFGSTLRGVVAVTLGDAMWMTVVRTILRGIAVLSGRSKQQAIVGTLREALDYARDNASSATPSRAELRAAVDLVCDALGVARLGVRE